MDRIIIIEGAQGVGKTTLTTLLREQIPYSNLYRMSGIKDKSVEGRTKICRHYINLLSYLSSDFDIGFTSIFDRFFTTEFLYSLLGHAKYDFSEYYQILKNSFCINCKDLYKVDFYLLTASEETFKRNLSNRGEKVQHANIEFGVEESLNQQKLFQTIFNDLKDTGFNVNYIDTSDLTPQQIADIIKEV